MGSDSGSGTGSGVMISTKRWLAKCESTCVVAHCSQRSNSSQWRHLRRLPEMPEPHLLHSTPGWSTNCPLVCSELASGMAPEDESGTTLLLLLLRLLECCAAARNSSSLIMAAASSSSNMAGYKIGNNGSLSRCAVLLDFFELDAGAIATALLFETTGSGRGMMTNT